MPLLCLFQSTPPRGRRHFTAGMSSSIGEFQSTPPRGRRLEDAYIQAIVLIRFNPRLRVGGDCALLECQSEFMGFNPRLRVGGDLGGIWIAFF